jgi:hypothetical protein
MNTNADPERPLARCKNCEHWGGREFRMSAIYGQCAVFAMQTMPNYGEHCTAFSSVTVRGASVEDAPPTPPADAPEPPWYSLLRYLHEQFPATVGHLPLATRIEAACIAHAEAHAAALAHSLQHHQDEACRHVKEILDLRAANAALAQERDAALAASKSHAEQRDLWQESWHKDTARLTAERGRLRTALERARAVARVRVGFGEAFWEPVVAQIDTALAPTQKEGA